VAEPALAGRMIRLAAHLKVLARISNGGDLSGNQGKTIRSSLDALGVDVVEFRYQSLWDRWVWLLAIIAILSLEWGLRRKLGFV
jgi:hypothetical protein